MPTCVVDNLGGTRPTGSEKARKNVKLTLTGTLVQGMPVLDKELRWWRAR